MAFKDYAFMVVPGIKAFVNFVKNLEKAKQDDGKVTFSEFVECVGTFLTELFTIAEPILKEDE
jgi:hypothetical protein